jgi:hypothetical protein
MIKARHLILRLLPEDKLRSSFQVVCRIRKALLSGKYHSQFPMGEANQPTQDFIDFINPPTAEKSAC